MKSSEIKLIFSDIDGTLISSDHIVTERTKLAIKEKVTDGLVFVPVSARMPAAIQPIIDSIGVKTPIISFNGALLQDANQGVIASYPMDLEIALDLIRFVEDFHEQVTWNCYSFGNWYVSSRQDKWVKREESIVGLNASEAHLSDLEKLDSIHKILLMGEPEVLDKVAIALKEKYPQLSIAKSSSVLLEIMAEGIEKGQAVKQFANHCHIPLSQAMAFGDNYNDWEMFEAVAYPVVMGNAPEEIKETFKCVTLDNNHDGIAKILESMGDRSNEE